MKFDPDLHSRPERPSSVHVFERSVEIARPKDQVLEFCLQGENFAALLPFPIAPAEDTDDLVGRAGHVYPFNLHFGPARLRWEAFIEDHDEQHFTDLMLKGPMRWWRHTHSAEPTADGCLYTDRVEYRSHLGGVADRTVVRKAMERLFAFRHRRMKQVLEDG